MHISVFEFDDPISYLEGALNSDERRGSKARLAEHLGCHTSFVSQVLGKRVQLSMEHSMRVSEFLQHSEEERRFFATIVLKEKAASRELLAFYQKQIDEMRQRRQPIREKIDVTGELNAEDRALYYSAWWYVAIHLLVGFPEFSTPDSIARKLSLDLALVNHTLDFLVGRGLVRQTENGFSIGQRRIHLGAGSPLVARHHANWRLRAIETQEKFRKSDLHYSGIIGIAKKDVLKLKSMLLEFLEEAEKIVRDSQEEAPYVLLLDLFDL